jgi:hypothetical protein
VRPRTFGSYAYALRKIARESTGQKDTNKKRFDPKSLTWRKAADLIPLAKLTPVKVTDWKLKVIAEAPEQIHSQSGVRAGASIVSFATHAL